MTLPGSLVDTAWLAAHLGDEELVVLDASWYLPAQGRDAESEYLEARVPGARRARLEQLSDPQSPLPHTAPSSEQMAEALRSLGISEESRVVVYDGMGLFSAPRVWWLLRAFGFERVSVLDGGLPRWRAEGRPLEAGNPSSSPSSAPGFVPRARPEMWASLDMLRELAATRRACILDARAAARFRGESPEPRPGLRSGHIPGSRSLPWTAVQTARGQMRPPQELDAVFTAAGVDLGGRVVTTCGSGVTAAVLSLALDTVGVPSAVYDGSWAEWGSSTLPLEVGPAQSAAPS